MLLQIDPGELQYLEDEWGRECEFEQYINSRIEWLGWREGCYLLEPDSPIRFLSECWILRIDFPGMVSRLEIL